MIFVDTSFWLALSLRRDRRVDQARELFAAHASERLITSNHVRGETWTHLRRRGGHGDAVFFLDRLDHAPRLRVEFVTSEQESEALRWLRRHDEREYSFVDATSFALMRSLRIREAFAFDGDFAAAGFVELRP
ncbi:MAG: type II toxin-antitoxin system VapC family toxin [Gaiellaceae bacterium]